MEPPKKPSDFVAASSGAAIALVSKGLGTLPPIVRYFDEYEEKVRSIRTEDNIWKIDVNGTISLVNFENIDKSVRHILKHFTFDRLIKHPVSAARYSSSLIRTILIQHKLLDHACNSPSDCLRYLREQYSSAADVLSDASYFAAGKALLRYFCQIGAAGWEDAHANVLKTIRSPSVRSKYRTVRDASAILDFDEERKIVSFFDSLSLKIGSDRYTDTSARILRDACILMCCFQHAMRPIQIANRNASHVRVHRTQDGSAIIHITFRFAKQRARRNGQEQTRKVKRDWTPIFVKWLQQRQAIDRKVLFDREDSLFGISPHEVTLVVAELTEQITGIRRTPYELRHTAAQRKADAGCTRLELAEFLMHSDIDTADAYIEMSPTQAEKINAALGLSPLFQAIDTALKSRSVNIDELNKLPEDQQISGAPHGHLIAGIGGCAIGQSFCPKTPALACYDCHKFMYLREIAVHEAARDSIRSIVAEFVSTSKGDRVTPAYGQLRRVLDTIEAIIADLEG
ncbi:MAG: site-specific integrase [Pseudomonadota bacterium]|nr:site-specific integrase [Pseudomonadota bacterium]